MTIRALRPAPEHLAVARRMVLDPHRSTPRERADAWRVLRTAKGIRPAAPNPQQEPSR